MDANIIKHPASRRGVGSKHGPSIMVNLHGVLGAIEKGLLVISDDVPAEQRREMQREFRVMRATLDELRRQAGIEHAEGSFWLIPEAEWDGAA